MTAMPEEIRAALEVASAKHAVKRVYNPDATHVVTEQGFMMACERSAQEGFIAGAQAAYALGVAQGKVEGLTVSNDYTDNQYAALIAQEENAKADLSRLLDALRDKKDDGGGV